MTEVLLISGALRRESTNTLLLREIARLWPEARTSFGDLRLPLYDGDLEAEHGVPAEVQRLADQCRAADAIVISTPEYNGNLPGVLKNALDWISRTEGKPMADTPLAIVSASAGRAGGARSQYSLRHCLVAFGPRILQGPEVMIAASYAAFDDDGRLKDENSVKMVKALLDALKAEVARTDAARAAA